MIERVVFNFCMTKAQWLVLFVDTWKILLATYIQLLLFC